MKIFYVTTSPLRDMYSNRATFIKAVADATAMRLHAMKGGWFDPLLEMAKISFYTDAAITYLEARDGDLGSDESRSLLLPFFQVLVHNRLQHDLPELLGYP